jgi:hypothetical protein
MKRYGMYNNDFTNLFECYERTHTDVKLKTPVFFTEQATNPSFPGLQHVKIFIIRPQGGADLTHWGKDVTVESDNGQGGVVLTCKEDDGTLIHVTTSEENADVTVSRGGAVVDQFRTVSPVKFKNDVLTIIFKQEV